MTGGSFELVSAKMFLPLSFQFPVFALLAGQKREEQLQSEEEGSAGPSSCFLSLSFGPGTDNFKKNEEERTGWPQASVSRAGFFC